MQSRGSPRDKLALGQAACGYASAALCPHTLQAWMNSVERAAGSVSLSEGVSEVMLNIKFLQTEAVKAFGL